MRIECRGAVTAIHTGYELVLVGLEAGRITVTPTRFWTPVAGGAQELQPSFEELQLALSPSGTRVVTRFREGLALVDIASRRASRSTAEALTFVTDDQLLSVRIVEGSVGEYALYLGAHGSSPARVALPAPTRVAWPQGGEGRLWDGEVPFQDGRLSERVLVLVNQLGQAVVDAESGLVICRRADGRTTAHHVPSEGEHSPMKLSAAVTREGVVVQFSGGRGAGVVNHFSIDGTHLGALHVVGNVSDAHVIDDTLLFAREDNSSGFLEVVIASLPTLAVREVVPTSVSTYRGAAGLSVRDGGRELWIGTEGTNVHRIVRSGRGWDAQPFDIETIPLIELAYVSSRELVPAASHVVPAATLEVVPREIVHAKFGPGRVVAQQGHGEQAKLDIEFADGSKKTLLAKFVRER